LYIDFLKEDKPTEKVIEENQNLLVDFQKEYPVHKDTDLFPAFFNFIECYLKLGEKQEVKKYLIVGLSKLLFVSKKDSVKEENLDYEDDESKYLTNKLRSKLDLLFARFNIDTENLSEAISKLSNSIILYSEIFGPEEIGLTQNYYYLAKYFSAKKDDEESEEERDIIIKNIFLKIADIWKKYFLREFNDLFESK
jgi:hypothetical protein